MRKGRTNLSEKTGIKKGLRCHICTGCGLCPGVTPKGSAAGNLHVLDEDALLGRRCPIQGGGKRLAAADIGTTTVAMLLYAEDGSVADRFLAVNPQTAFGADVISRIRAAQENAAAEKMRMMILETLERGIRRFQGKLAPEETMFLVLAANTTMTYLLRGLDTSELGHAPFRASHLDAVQTRVGEVPCFVFPGMSAFVGGDITAGIYACGMAESEELTLFIDLGTNGEMVLGNSRRRIACATAAGPAFEGGVNRGIWGADMISFLATLRRQDVLDETGLLADPYFEKGIRIGNVTVTKESVRSVQLAKGAIAAGMEILLAKYGIAPEQVDRVVLAGGFGYYLNPCDAAEIGLLPVKLAEKTVSGGNTVLTGDLLAGREILGGRACGEMAEELKHIASQTETLNLAAEPEFEKSYIRLINLRKTV